MADFPFPLADPDDPGQPPMPADFRSPAYIRFKRVMGGLRGRRRLAVVDSHFPWVISGFRYHEAEEILRRRPDTLFFSLHRLTDAFPAEVHPLAIFPTVAPAAGVTDVHVVFLNFAASILGIEGRPDIPSVPGARRDISLRGTLQQWGIRTHTTLYPGVGSSLKPQRQSSRQWLVAAQPCSRRCRG
jgi:hypothetical protein